MIDLKKINKKEIAKEISIIHLSSFKGFFLSFLGKGFLNIYYQGLIEHKKSGVIGAFFNNQIIGFLAYSEDSSNLYSFLLKRKIFKFALFSLFSIIKKPIIIFRLLRAFSYPNKKKTGEKYIDLLSIGVLPNYTGMGIGKLLIKKLIDYYQNEDFSYIQLETDADNNNMVNQFYINNGFILINDYITNENRKMNLYRYFFIN